MAQDGNKAYDERESEDHGRAYDEGKAEDLGKVLDEVGLPEVNGRAEDRVRKTIEQLELRAEKTFGK